MRLLRPLTTLTLLTPALATLNPAAAALEWANDLVSGSERPEGEIGVTAAWNYVDCGLASDVMWVVVIDSLPLPIAFEGESEIGRHAALSAADSSSQSRCPLIRLYQA